MGERGHCLLVGVMVYKFPVPPSTRDSASQKPERRFNSTRCVQAFDECFDRYQECLSYRDWQTSVFLNEEVENYIVDFELTAKRTLADEDSLSRLFRLMFIDGRTGADCGLALDLRPIRLIREVRDLKVLVGNALLNRGLFPLERYFNSERAKTSESPASRTRLAA